MILHRYSATGLFVTSIDVADGSQIPPLSTFLQPPDLTPEESPYAVFRNGVWHLESVRPTEEIHSSLDANVQILKSFQAKAALADAGLYELVQAAIDSPGTPVRAKLAWQEGVDFRRDNPIVALIAQQVGLTESQIDDLFIAGSKISADTL
tara:strand:- start:623 stop:1075 length:453 start_codon:yes stop_codon:yes gene_type:complete